MTEVQHKPSIALVLQGGGALGAYQVGVFRALAERGLHPDRVAGVSIGAINAAIIAGNAPEDRIGKLEELWDAISRPELGARGPFAPLAALHTLASHAEALLFGQPNFFRPRTLNPYLLTKADPQSVSFYDPTPLLFTLRRFADFKLIESKAIRLALGATDVETGRIETFDNRTVPIGPEHVLASASVPPGFPASRVGTRLYWDGAAVATTPLEAILDDALPPHLVVFVIDLWDSSGPAPTNMREVLWRSKQIQHASRTPAHIEALAAKLNYRHVRRELEAATAARTVEGSEDAPPIVAPSTTSRVDIVHVIRRAEPSDVPNVDADFSKPSIARHREAGYENSKAALAAEPWLRQELPPHGCVLVHRVENGTVTTLPALESKAPAEPRSAVA